MSLHYVVRVSAEHAYPVRYAAGALDRYGEIFRAEVGPGPVVVITDRRVDRLYGARLSASFERAGIEIKAKIAVEEGETSKDLRTYLELLELLVEARCDRRTTIVNFGGGMVCDLGGFAAATYLRGIPYANFATSLLGQIDACVGGKVAVNTSRGKNLIGAFHHPRHVLGDPALLATLEARDVRSGLAEGIKMAILCDPELFATFERERDALLGGNAVRLAHVIARASQLKMDLIGEDPYEKDLRRPLNFGHTLGHPIETEFAYRGIRHGEAVAIGMAVATHIALELDVVSPIDAERILDLLAAYGLLGHEFALRPERVLHHLHTLRLSRAGHLHFVLPEAIGRARILELEEDAILAGFARHAAYAAEVRT